MDNGTHAVVDLIIGGTFVHDSNIHFLCDFTK